MRKFFLFCLVLVFFSTLLTTVVSADEIGTVTITGSYVNIRSGPGLDYNKIDKLQKDTKIPVLAEENGWYKIKLSSGEIGWVIDDYSELESKKSLVVTINEKSVDFDTSPYIDQNDRTMVPIRFVAEELGAKVGWDGKEKKVNISFDNKNVFLWIDNKKAQVNEEEIELDTEPVIKDVRTMVPLRFVSEILGAQVSWDSATQTIAIFLEKKPQENVASSKTKKVAVITGNVVNIRSGPGLNYDKIDKYPQNTVFDVLGESTDNDNKTWYKIQLPYEKEGWVAGWLVKISFYEGNNTDYANDLRKEALIIGSVVNVRSGASLQYDVVGQVIKGDSLKVEGQLNDWYEVSLTDGSRGWIHNSLVSIQSADLSRGNISRDGYKDNFTLIKNNVDYPAVINVDTAVTNNGTQLLVQGNTELNYSTIILQNPLRLVIDIAGTTTAVSPENLININDDLIKSVRVGQFTEDITRIVVDLNQSVSHSVQSFEDGKVLNFFIQKSSLQDKIIVLDPGHGSIQPGNWSDPGAVGPTNLYEKDVVLDISKKVADMLNDQGATVIMTRTGDTVLSLAGRAAIANDVNADIFVSVHANASSYDRNAKGSSVYYYAPSWRNDSAKREKLARLIQYYMVNNAGTKDLGVFERGFTVLTETQIPSVLVETAFISNSYEEKLLKTDDFQNKLARGIVQGINSYFMENK